MGNSSKNFLISMFKFSVTSWVQAAIAFVSVPIVTRAFSPEEFGKINMFTLAISIASIFVGLSMEQSYLRFFKEKVSVNEKKSLLTQCVVANLGSFIIFLVLVFLYGNKLSIYLFGEMNGTIIYFAFPIMVLLTIIMSYQSIYYRMNENVLGYFIFGLLCVVANKVFMVLAALYKPTYSVGILLTFIGVTITVVCAKIYNKESFDISISLFNYKEAIQYITYSFPLVPVALISVLNTAIIRFLLKDNLSYSALGIFSAAVTVASLLSLIQTGFTTYWSPFMYANYKTEKQLIKRIHSAITFAMIAVSLFIIIFNDVIFLIIGEKYRLGKDIFAFLLIAPVVYTISETTCYGIYINKKTHLHIYCSLASFAFNTLFGLVLIPHYGILGAAIANAVGGIILFALRSFLGLREYNSVEKFYRTILAITILILASIINYYIHDILVRNGMILLLMALLIVIYHEIFSTMINLLKNKLTKRGI